LSLSRRTFTKEFKLNAVRRLNTGASLAEVARSFEVSPNVLHRWRREFEQGPGSAFPGLGKRRWEETEKAALERKIGQQTLEIDFLKRVLQKVEETRLLQDMHSSAPSTPKLKKNPAKKRA
jgi:transposase